MGTYTTNKNLFMPSVGETGWGTLVNGNFTTIDTFLKPITVSGSTYTFTGNQTGGSISATSITNSGTLTSTGKITANGGIAGTTGTFSGAVTGKSFNGIVPYRTMYISNTDFMSPTFITNSGNGYTDILTAWSYNQDGLTRTCTSNTTYTAWFNTCYFGDGIMHVGAINNISGTVNLVFDLGSSGSRTINITSPFSATLTGSGTVKRTLTLSEINSILQKGLVFKWTTETIIKDLYVQMNTSSKQYVGFR